MNEREAGAKRETLPLVTTESHTGEGEKNWIHGRKERNQALFCAWRGEKF
jgi:hypothetical protein